MWLTDSWGSWSALYYFDLLDSTFKRYPSPAGVTNGLFSEPRLYPSGDGSMMMVMATNPSSIFPSWRYDTSTDSLTSPSGIPVAYRVSLNASGSRMLVEWGSLYDTTSMSLIGKAQSTSAGSVVLSVLSPDGQRVYSLVTASASSDLIDHVEVFDANQAVPGTSNLVSLGQIPVADQAGYCAPSSSLSCNWIGGLTISSFGNTLFWTANERLVVIPIPSSISGIASAPKTQLLKARL